MNNIQKVIEERNTKINKILVTLTDITGFDHSGKSLEAFHVAEAELKSHISETIRQVLQAVDEEVEHIKLIEASFPTSSLTLDWKKGHNKALINVQSLLKSTKENIK